MRHRRVWGRLAAAISITAALCACPSRHVSGPNDAGNLDGGWCGLAAGHDDAGGYAPISVNGDTGSTNGIFDPSLWYPPDSGFGYMSYTSVPSTAGVHTRIAYSNDQGASWWYVQDVNQATPITVTTSDPTICGAGSCSGSWVHEVSSLVEDPTDPNPNARFKLFTHSYFVAQYPDAGQQIEYQIGVISMYATALPTSTATWTEQPILGWSSTSPSSSTGVNQNVSTDPAFNGQMTGCLALSEPGALVRGGVIDLALTCPFWDSAAGAVSIDIRLLRSADHGATWSYVSRLVSAADAQALGAVGPPTPEASAPDLFEQNGKVYLLFSPNGTVVPGMNGYRGCLELILDDVDAGTVARCGGTPAVLNRYMGIDGIFTGGCTAAQGSTATGVLVPMADLFWTPMFQIKGSRMGPP